MKSPGVKGSSFEGDGPIEGWENSMPVQLLCPNLRCRKYLTVPDEVRGKLVKCTHCQTMFRVPDQSKKPEQPKVPAGQ
jgi:hypothetical protein